MSESPGRRFAVCHNTSRYLYLHYRQLLEALLATGSTVRVFAPEDEYSARLQRLGVSFTEWSLEQHGMQPVREWQSIRALRGLLTAFDPSDVFTFSIKPNLYAGLARRRGVMFRHYVMVTGLGYVFIGDNPAKVLLRRAVVQLSRVALAGAERVFFQNPADRDTMRRLGMVRAEQSVVIPGTGIDCDYYTPENRDPGSGRVRFLFVGRLLADKGVGELLEAARLLRGGGVAVRLVGPYDGNPGGISREAVKAAEAEGAVSAPGEVEDVRAELAAADVFVLPSYREGLSRSILEAMASGLPVVTTDVPGCRDLVSPGVNGLLVPVGDARALARAMQSLADDAAMRSRMGAASRSIAEQRFDQRSVNSRVLDEMGFGS